MSYSLIFINKFQDHERNFLTLIEKITNGSVSKYIPGLIIGGSNIYHNCGNKRGLGYYLEPLILLALFAKKSLKITLQGITNHSLDSSVDIYRTIILPMMRHLLKIFDRFDLIIINRGVLPFGGGKVVLKVP